MDNTIAYELGKVVNQTLINKEVGDNIDKGLILCRLLNEAGFNIIQKEKTND